MIEYEEIGQKLLIHFESDDLDLLQVGILNSSLHEILNQVAITILNQENEYRELEQKPKLFDFIPQTLNREDILIRARVVGVSEGSIDLNIQPIVAQIFTEPGAVAILNSLVSNTIWAIATYGRRVVGSKIFKHGESDRVPDALPATSARKRLRPRVEHLIKHLKDASNGGRIILRSGDEELIVEFYSHDGPSERRREHARRRLPFN